MLAKSLHGMRRLSSLRSHASRRQREDRLLLVPSPVEALEARTLLAGNVTAVLTATGHLRITGDNASNQIAISTTAGITTVAGMLGTGTTVNGAPLVLINLTIPATITGNLLVNMRGGDDFVEIDDMKVQGDLRLRTAAGNDTVGIFGTSIQDDALINTAAGDDAVVVVDSFVGDQLRIATAGGIDLVGLESCLGVVGRTTIQTGGGDDGLLLQGFLQGLVVANMGGGNDRFDVGNYNPSSSTTLIMGSGDDELRIASTAMLDVNDQAKGGGGFDFMGVAPGVGVLPQTISVENEIIPLASADADIFADAVFIAGVYVFRGGDPLDLIC